MRKKMIISILVLLVITVSAGAYLFREYNRRNPSVSELDAAYFMKATELISSFSKDSANANTKYLGKVIQVAGFVKSVDKDGTGSYTISLGDSVGMSSVRCSMTDIDSAYLSSQKITGRSLVLKGICTGFMPDDMGLGADVILNRSVIKQ